MPNPHGEIVCSYFVKKRNQNSPQQTDDNIRPNSKTAEVEPAKTIDVMLELKLQLQADTEKFAQSCATRHAVIVDVGEEVVGENNYFDHVKKVLEAALDDDDKVRVILFDEIAKLDEEKMKKNEAIEYIEELKNQDNDKTKGLKNQKKDQQPEQSREGKSSLLLALDSFKKHRRCRILLFSGGKIDRGIQHPNDAIEEYKNELLKKRAKQIPVTVFSSNSSSILEQIAWQLGDGPIQSLEGDPGTISQSRCWNIKLKVTPCNGFSRVLPKDDIRSKWKNERSLNESDTYGDFIHSMDENRTRRILLTFEERGNSKNEPCIATVTGTYDGIDRTKYQLQEMQIKLRKDLTSEKRENSESEPCMATVTGSYDSIDGTTCQLQQMQIESEKGDDAEGKIKKMMIEVEAYLMLKRICKTEGDEGDADNFKQKAKDLNKHINFEFETFQEHLENLAKENKIWLESLSDITKPEKSEEIAEKRLSAKLQTLKLAGLRNVYWNISRRRAHRDHIQDAAKVIASAENQASILAAKWMTKLKTDRQGRIESTQLISTMRKKIDRALKIMIEYNYDVVTCREKLEELLEISGDEIDLNEKILSALSNGIEAAKEISDTAAECDPSSNRRDETETDLSVELRKFLTSELPKIQERLCQLMKEIVATKKNQSHEDTVPESIRTAKQKEHETRAVTGSDEYESGELRESINEPLESTKQLIEKQRSAELERFLQEALGTLGRAVKTMNKLESDSLRKQLNLPEERSLQEALRTLGGAVETMNKLESDSLRKSLNLPEGWLSCRCKIISARIEAVFWTAAKKTLKLQRTLDKKDLTEITDAHQKVQEVEEKYFNATLTKKTKNWLRSGWTKLDKSLDTVHKILKKNSDEFPTKVKKIAWEMGFTNAEKMYAGLAEAKMEEIALEAIDQISSKRASANEHQDSEERTRPSGSQTNEHPIGQSSEPTPPADNSNNKQTDGVEAKSKVENEIRLQDERPYLQRMLNKITSITQQYCDYGYVTEKCQRDIRIAGNRWERLLDRAALEKERDFAVKLFEMKEWEEVMLKRAYVRMRCIVLDRMARITRTGRYASDCKEDMWSSAEILLTIKRVKCRIRDVKITCIEEFLGQNGRLSDASAANWGTFMKRCRKKRDLVELMRIMLNQADSSEDIEELQFKCAKAEIKHVVSEHLHAIEKYSNVHKLGYAIDEISRRARNEMEEIERNFKDWMFRHNQTMREIQLCLKERIKTLTCAFRLKHASYPSELAKKTERKNLEKCVKEMGVNPANQSEEAQEEWEKSCNIEITFKACSEIENLKLFDDNEENLASDALSKVRREMKENMDKNLKKCDAIQQVNECVTKKKNLFKEIEECVRSHSDENLASDELSKVRREMKENMDENFKKCDAIRLVNKCVTEKKNLFEKIEECIKSHSDKIEKIQEEMGKLLTKLEAENPDIVSFAIEYDLAATTDNFFKNQELAKSSKDHEKDLREKFGKAVAWADIEGMERIFEECRWLTKKKGWKKDDRENILQEFESQIVELRWLMATETRDKAALETLAPKLRKHFKEKVLPGASDLSLETIEEVTEMLIIQNHQEEEVISNSSPDAELMRRTDDIIAADGEVREDEQDSGYYAFENSTLTSDLSAEIQRIKAMLTTLLNSALQKIGEIERRETGSVTQNATLKNLESEIHTVKKLLEISLKKTSESEQNSSFPSPESSRMSSIDAAALVNLPNAIQKMNEKLDKFLKSPEQDKQMNSILDSVSPVSARSQEGSGDSSPKQEQDASLLQQSLKWRLYDLKLRLQHLKSSQNMEKLKHAIEEGKKLIKKVELGERSKQKLKRHLAKAKKSLRSLRERKETLKVKLEEMTKSLEENPSHKPDNYETTCSNITEAETWKDERQAFGIHNEKFENYIRRARVDVASLERLTSKRFTKLKLWFSALLEGKELTSATLRDLGFSIRFVTRKDKDFMYLRGLKPVMTLEQKEYFEMAERIWENVKRNISSNAYTIENSGKVGPHEGEDEKSTSGARQPEEIRKRKQSPPPRKKVRPPVPPPERSPSQGRRIDPHLAKDVHVNLHDAASKVSRSVVSEISSYNNPPLGIKSIAKAVSILDGQPKTSLDEWKKIRRTFVMKSPSQQSGSFSPNSASVKEANKILQGFTLKESVQKSESGGLLYALGRCKINDYKTSKNPKAKVSTTEPCRPLKRKGIDRHFKLP